MKGKLRYSGRVRQCTIYFNKLLRTFIYQKDWKVLPMCAAIASLVMYVVGKNLFKTQEGTMVGCFALTCVCLWNGLFNSIQVVCRERAIVKREHRAGMHISSYVVSHMAYQFLLCAMQTGIILAVCIVARVQLPEEGLVTPWFMVDFVITLLLATYAADMLGLAISCIVRNTTVAMTVMPFVLIFQLVFSGSYFSLSGFAAKLTKFTVCKWGIKGLVSLGNYNSLPMVTLWNTLLKFRKVEISPGRTIQDYMALMNQDELARQIQAQSGLVNQDAAYSHISSNVLQSWGALLLMALVCAVVAIVMLEFVDNDKR